MQYVVKSISQIFKQFVLGRMWNFGKVLMHKSMALILNEIVGKHAMEP